MPTKDELEQELVTMRAEMAEMRRQLKSMEQQNEELIAEKEKEEDSFRLLF